MHTPESALVPLSKLPAGFPAVRGARPFVPLGTVDLVSSCSPIRRPGCRAWAARSSGPGARRSPRPDGLLQFGKQVSSTTIHLLRHPRSRKRGEAPSCGSITRRSVHRRPESDRSLRLSRHVDEIIAKPLMPERRRTCFLMPLSRQLLCGLCVFPDRPRAAPWGRRRGHRRRCDHVPRLTRAVSAWVCSRYGHSCDDLTSPMWPFRRRKPKPPDVHESFFCRICGTIVGYADALRVRDRWPICPSCIAHVVALNNGTSEPDSARTWLAQAASDLSVAHDAAVERSPHGVLLLP